MNAGMDGGVTTPNSWVIETAVFVVLIVVWVFAAFVVAVTVFVGET